MNPTTICTECGYEIEFGSEYIAGSYVRHCGTGKKDEWNLELAWACSHRPMPTATIRLGSLECVEQFCVKNPQYKSAIIAMLQEVRDRGGFIN